MTTKNFNEFIDVNEQFGKILICGLEGYGKTLLLSTIAVHVMLNGLSDCAKSYEEVDRLNALGYRFTKQYEHLCFVAFIQVNCLGTEMPLRKSYDFDPFHFMLPCEDYDSDIYPPYSSLFVPECQRVWPSYKSELLRQEIYGLMETGRQSKFNLVGDAQRLFMVAKPVRDLMNRIIFFTKKVTHETNTKGEVIGHILHIIEFNENRLAEHYANDGITTGGVEYDLKIDKCMFENFSSDYFKFMNLKGRENQDFRIIQHTDIQDLEDVANMTSTLLPDGYLISKTKTKKFEPNVDLGDNPDIDDMPLF